MFDSIYTLGKTLPALTAQLLNCRLWDLLFFSSLKSQKWRASVCSGVSSFSDDLNQAMLCLSLLFS